MAKAAMDLGFRGVRAKKGYARDPLARVRVGRRDGNVPAHHGMGGKPGVR